MKDKVDIEEAANDRMIVCLLFLRVYWDLGLHAVIPQLMRPMDTHKLQLYFWKQTMLSPQYMQALPGPHWVVGVTHATYTRSDSLACCLCHLHLLRQHGRMSMEGSWLPYTQPFLWMVRSCVAASFLWGSLVWCVYLFPPGRVHARNHRNQGCTAKWEPFS